MKKPVEVGYNDGLAEVVRKKATTSCKKCHGTGFVGVLVKKNGGRSHLVCKCVVRNGLELERKSAT